MPKIKRIGRRLTSYEVSHFDNDNPEDRKQYKKIREEHARRWNGGKDDFFRVIAKAEQWAHGILKGKTPPFDTRHAYIEAEAENLLVYIGLARDHIEKNDAIGAARFAVQIGVLIERLRIQTDGVTVRGTRKAQALKTPVNTKRWEKYQAEVDEMHKKNPRRLYTPICEEVAKKFNVSLKTITRYTDNWNP